jgi:ribosome-associated translation inhibitor RaiA/HSP20 family molecular chaperone IbpA
MRLNTITESSRKASQFSWNIVTRGLHGHPFLRQRIHSKSRALERHLQRFPPDAVHLLIEFERRPRKEEYRAVLMLRLPSHILHSDKSAKSVIAALSNSVKALLKELKSLKERLREEPQWKRKTRRKTVAFAPEPSENTGEPQGAAEIRDAFFESHRQWLMRFARRAANRARNQGHSIADPELVELVGAPCDRSRWADKVSIEGFQAVFKEIDSIAPVDIERWMWGDCELLARAERLHHQFFTPVAVEGAIGWSPPVGLYETEDEFIAVIALPGVAPGDVKIRLLRLALEVRGHHRMPPLVRGVATHRLEIPQGAFCCDLTCLRRARCSPRRVLKMAASFFGCKSRRAFAEQNARLLNLLRVGAVGYWNLSEVLLRQQRPLRPDTPGIA